MEVVNVGRSRPTTSARPLNWWSRVVDRSGWSPRSSVCTIRYCDAGSTSSGRWPASATWRPIMQATPMSADQASEIARLRQENERLRMQRDILKKSIAIFAGTRT